jgi:hypothetical protein
MLPGKPTDGKQIRVNSSSKRGAYSVLFSCVLLPPQLTFRLFPSQIRQSHTTGSALLGVICLAQEPACWHHVPAPISVLLLEDGQRMTCTRGGLSLAGRSNNDGELRSHKGPIPANSDLLNLAPPVKLWRPSTCLSMCCNSEAGFAHGRLAGHEKENVIRHQ